MKHDSYQDIVKHEEYSLKKVHNNYNVFLEINSTHCMAAVAHAPKIMMHDNKKYGSLLTL